MLRSKGSLSQQGGFAAVDALMALLILSITLTLALSGLQQAARIAQRSEETVEATALARQLLAQSGDGVSSLVGRSGSLLWSLSTERLGGSRAYLCAQGLLIRSVHDHRSYRFETAIACSESAS